MLLLWRRSTKPKAWILTNKALVLEKGSGAPLQGFVSAQIFHTQMPAFAMNLPCFSANIPYANACVCYEFALLSGNKLTNKKRTCPISVKNRPVFTGQIRISAGIQTIRPRPFRHQYTWSQPHIWLCGGGLPSGLSRHSVPPSYRRGDQSKLSLH